MVLGWMVVDSAGHHLICSTSAAPFMMQNYTLFYLCDLKSIKKASRFRNEVLSCKKYSMNKVDLRSMAQR